MEGALLAGRRVADQVDICSAEVCGAFICQKMFAAVALPLSSCGKSASRRKRGFGCAKKTFGVCELLFGGNSFPVDPIRQAIVVSSLVFCIPSSDGDTCA